MSKMEILIRRSKEGLELLGNTEIVPDFSKPVTFTDIRGRKTINSFSTKVEHALYSIISQESKKVFVYLPADDVALSTLYKYASRHVIPTIKKVYSMYKSQAFVPALDLSSTYISYRLDLTGIYIYTSPLAGKS